MNPSRRHWLAACCIACVLPLAVACGGAKSPSPTPAPTVANSARTPAGAAATRTPTSAAVAAITPPANATPTASGLRYVDQVVGAGAAPRMDQRVTVHYTGRLAATGQTFDSSIERGQPATFPMNGVIKGFSEALSTMHVGGKRTVYIPAALGYGAVANGPIPPNSDLVFEIELLAIQ